MRIEKLVVGELATNCYLVWDKDRKEGIVIDPGDEGTFIVEKISHWGFCPKLIVVTHGHFDHLLAVLEIKLTFGVPWVIGEKDAVLVEKAAKSARFWLKREVDPVPEPDGWLEGGGKIIFGEEGLTVLRTPGHTPGGVSLYSQKERVVFTGDTLFANGGVGRTDLAGGDERLLRESIGKLLKLPNKTQIFPGHGRESEVEVEREFHGL